MNGAKITYAEIDGESVCILDDGQWCERGSGHGGPHVIAPYVSASDWDKEREATND